MSDDRSVLSMGDAVVSPAIQSQVTALVSSLVDCTPSPTDSIDLFFHSLIDRLLQHSTTSPISSFSPSLSSHVDDFTQLIRVLYSLTTPSAPSPALSALLSPLPSSLSGPLLSALTIRHPALWVWSVKAAVGLSPAPLLTSFDVSVRLITSSAHLATVKTPTVVLSLGREGMKEDSVELSTAQLDALLDQLHIAHSALMTV